MLINLFLNNIFGFPNHNIHPSLIQPKPLQGPLILVIPLISLLPQLILERLPINITVHDPLHFAGLLFEPKLLLVHLSRLLSGEFSCGLVLVASCVEKQVGNVVCRNLGWCLLLVLQVKGFG